MEKVMSFDSWNSSRSTATNETKNLGSKGFPKEDLKDNFKEWKDDHEDQANELFDKLKERHPDADKDELKQLATDWVGTKEEKEAKKEAEEKEAEEKEAEEKEAKAKAKEEAVKESAVFEGKMKEIDILSQEATSKADFEEKLKAYVKEIGKPDLADDKDFIEAMTADWKPSAE